MDTKNETNVIEMPADLVSHGDGGDGDSRAQDATRGLLRERRDQMLDADPYLPRTEVTKELLETNGRQDAPLDRSEVSEICGEVPYKRELITKDRAHDYLIYQGAKARGDGESYEEMRKLVGQLYAIHCEPGLSPGDLDLIAREIVEGRTEQAGTGFTASDLMKEEIPEMRWVVPDILPEGVTILAGKPKIGKSWLALGLCVATATGGVALGTKRVEQGDALYLALEDSKRRLQYRLRKVLSGEAPDNLYFDLQWPRLNEGGTARLERWLQDHPSAKLVVIDTLATVRKPPKGNNVYHEDYEALKGLLPLAAEYNVAVVVVHHLRKAEADDPLDEINSSAGLTGGVDSALVLKKGSDGATLYARGRDVEETNLALAWDTELCNWRLTGKTVEDLSDMGDTRQRIYQCIKGAGKTMGPKEVAERTGLKPDTVRKTMSRMEEKDELVKDSRGQYSVPMSLPSLLSPSEEEDAA